MEASALHAPASISRLGLSPAFLRLRSDEQLVSLFRAGSDNAFDAIHDRYRQRLFAYVRQMMGAGSRQDAEDVLQDVFVRAYGALRADDRPVLLRAWLYRVAHNRCIDVLRRPVPPPAEIYEVSRKPLHDPFEQAQRREELSRLVRDVGQLPDQQRSALLMREIDGMPYQEISEALDVTVPAVKSLLVRARVGLVESAEARDMDCAVIREDLAAAYDKGVKASGRARRHMRECSGCREYRSALRGIRKSFAALSPVGAVGPFAVLAKALGIGSAGGGAAAAGGGTAISTGVATATACKVAAVVCTAALTAGAGAEVSQIVKHRAPAHRAPVAHAAPVAAAAVSHAPIVVAPAQRRPALVGVEAATRPAHAVKRDATATAPAPATSAPANAPAGTAADPASDTGGTAAPAEDTTAPQHSGDTTAPGTSDAPAPQDPGTSDAPTAQSADTGGGAAPPSDGGSGAGSPDGSTPPEH